MSANCFPGRAIVYGGTRDIDALVQAKYGSCQPPPRPPLRQLRTRVTNRLLCSQVTLSLQICAV